MKHLFVPYELALKLKEKGFDEKCFGFYRDEGNLQFWNITYNCRSNSDCVKIYDSDDGFGCTSPLYQQVIDWFREKHNIFIWVEKGDSFFHAFIKIKNKKERIPSSTYYEALNKAIEEALKLI